MRYMFNFLLRLRRSQSTKNGLYSIVDVLISPVLMVVVTPIFLKYLGVENYASWVLVNSIISSLALFNFSGTDVLIRYISLARGDNNSSEIKQTLSTIFVFQIIVASVIYLLFLLVSPHFFEHTTKFYSVYTILYTAIPLFFFKQFEQILYAFLKGHEQFKQIAVFSVLSKVLFFFIQSIIAIITGSLFEVFKYALISAIVIFLLEVVYVKYRYKDAIFIREAKIVKFKSLFNFGGWSWLASIALILTTHSDKWIVSSLMGLSIFGYYSLGILVFNQLHNIIAASVSWVFPKISKRGLQNKDLAIEYYWLTSYIVLFSLIISFALINLHFIFEAWLGREVYAQSKEYIDLFLIMFPVFTMPIVSYYYLLGLGLVKNKFWVDLSVLCIKVIAVYSAITLSFQYWPLVFLSFLSFQFVFYARVLSKYIDIRFSYMIGLLVAQLFIVYIRVSSYG